MSRAVIVLGGTIADYDFTEKLIFDDDFIICADGGISHLKKIGISPDVWIGDNDSCNMNKDEFADITSGCEIIRLNPIKDATDGEAACDYACSRGFDEVVILGYFGTRMDHVLCNLLMLKKFADCGINAKAVNEKSTVFFAKRHNEICRGDFRYVSVIPLSSRISGVSNEGLFYSLSNASLERYSSRGISNELIGDKCTIDINSGDALIILSKD